jgi:hypothetical protein
MKISAKLVLVAFLLGFSAPVLAGEALVASEATVDVTGKDAVDARTQAMSKAQSVALLDLLSKLAAPGQSDQIMASLDEKKIAALVRGTEVLDEKMSGNRYRATMRISFDADQVSSLITKAAESADLEGLTAKTGSFLIIPSYEEDGTVMLWEDKNAWRNVWKQIGLEVTAGDVVVPYGDNSDQSLIGVKTLSSATFSSLSPMTIRYGASDIVILQAKYIKSPELMLTVIKRRINRLQNEVNMLTYRADPQETRDTLLARAARDVVDGLRVKKTEEISTAKGVMVGEKNKVMVLASITTLDSWIQLKERLTSLPMIERLEMLAMSSQQIDMIIHYRGSPDALANAIAGKKLRLVQNQDYWVVSRD